MTAGIPEHQWQPLPLDDVRRIFSGAPFTWALAGGYAIEQFLGEAIREHSDTDVVVFRDEQLVLQRWLLPGWSLWAADPPGTLRPWREHEFLPYGIHDIWGHRQENQAWELQVMLAEVDGADWFMRSQPDIRGRRDQLIAEYKGFPCLRVEVQLLYKARRPRPKDTLDFRACLPQLTAGARQWLGERSLLISPAGHPWLEDLGP
jgi:hypothetical protein